MMREFLIDYSKLFDILRDKYASLSYSRPSGEAFVPLRFFLELTYRCNLNCPYCYVGENKLQEELTLEEWKNVMEQIPRYAFITLVGGEPLLRQDFKEILHLASRRVYGKLNVVTNGVLLSDEMTEAFIKSKTMLLSVLLDGWGETHDKNRRREGLFDTVISNLEKIKSLKKRPMVDIKTIILKNNLEDLPKLYKYCSESGFEFFSLSFLRNNNLKQNSCLREEFGAEFYENAYPVRQYFDMRTFERIYRELLEISKTSKTKIRFSPKFENSEGSIVLNIKKFFTESGDKPPKDLYYPCKYPYSNMIINPSGDAYPCLSVKMGNIKQMKLVEAFNTQEFCHFRKNLRTSGTFSACQMCCELTPYA